MIRAISKITTACLFATLLAVFSTAPALAADTKTVGVQAYEIELAKGDKSSQEKWNLAIREVYDKRAAEVVGTKKIGMVDQRFSDEDAPIELDKEPALYLREQVGRFLFLRGLEASSTARAKVFVDLALERFEIVRDSKGLGDKTTFNLAFTVTLITRSGDELGSITLKKNQWIEKFSPFGGESATSELIAEALAGTLTTLEENDIFREATSR